MASRYILTASSGKKQNVRNRNEIRRGLLFYSEVISCDLGYFSASLPIMSAPEMRPIQ